MIRIGSLCSGYGGLDMAVEWIFDAQTAWHAENAAAPSAVLAARWPGIPNHGDITRINWTTVEPIDIITAGYPCQPFALAGRRKGTTDERHLWPYVRQAICGLRPRIVVLENVAGHRSLGFGRVLGDLAEEGLYARWTSLRAADIGAPHGRERLFIVAYPADTGGGVSARRPDISQRQPPQRETTTDNLARTATDTGSEELPRWARLCADEPTGLWRTRPSDSADDHEFSWGDYTQAINQWASIIGRRPPNPVVTGNRGGARVSARFIEWMMGLPAGWVTDVYGVTRRQDQIEMLGNGVVPQQATAALTQLLEASWAAET